MLPDPILCGRKITVAIPPKNARGWTAFGIAVLVVIAVVLCVVLRGAVFFPVGALLCARRPRPPRQSRWVTLASHSIQVDGVIVQLNGVRSVERVRDHVVLRLKRSMRVKIDLGMLSASARAVFVRHVEARRLIARSSKRPRADEVALEAFYVYDAHAVRVHERTLREILPPNGPWPALARHERIYVRELPHRANPYRAADPAVVAVGSLK